MAKCSCTVGQHFDVPPMLECLVTHVSVGTVDQHFSYMNTLFWSNILFINFVAHNNVGMLSHASNITSVATEQVFGHV